MAEKWIQKAIRRPGAFTAKAKRAGLSVAAYASKVLKKGSRADATTKRQAVLYRTLRRFRRRRAQGEKK
ncbi:MAG: hypothetical protein N2383_16265 [Caldilineales bacterium]|nr:hypothetical protein [Caldilineales bacterium]